MKQLFGFLFLMTLSVFTACSDSNGPVIEIGRPANNSIFSAGDVISFDIRVTDDMEIREIDIEGKDGLTLSQAIDLAGFSDLANISFGFDLEIPDTFVDGEYTLEITAIDNDGNEASEDISFIIQG